MFDSKLMAVSCDSRFQIIDTLEPSGKTYWVDEGILIQCNVKLVINIDTKRIS